MEPQTRVVVVDDDADVLESLLSLLNEGRVDGAGDTIVGAPDAATALTLVETHKPDMVVVDLALPQLDDGLRLLRTLRARHGRDLLLVVLTGAPEHQSYEAALEAGSDHVLFKPAGLDQLARMITPDPAR